MKLIIDTEVLNNSEVTIDQFLIALAVYLKSPIRKDSFKGLQKLDYTKMMDVDVSTGIYDIVLTREGKEAVSSLLSQCEKGKQTTDNILNYEDIAAAMIEEFPKGRKEGTNYMWRDSKTSLARRLKTLNIKYEIPFTKESAVNATKAYVSSFNGCYRTMRLLKYFIYKIEIKDGKEEFSSELATLLENEDQEVMNREDWMNTLV